MRYFLKNKNFGMYYKSRYSKGSFHYVIRREEATALSKQQADKLLNEIKNKENFEIIRIGEK